MSKEQSENKAGSEANSFITRIKVGDVLKDGYDREHTVISLDGPDGNPVVTKYNGCVRSFMENGQFYTDTASHCDLILPKRTRTITRWVNVYAHAECMYNTEISAMHNATTDALAVAVPMTYELEY